VIGIILIPIDVYTAIPDSARHDEPRQHFVVIDVTYFVINYRWGAESTGRCTRKALKMFYTLQYFGSPGSAPGPKCTNLGIGVLKAQD